MKAFNRTLVENSVKVGSLMLLTVNETGDTRFFFLGVCLQKPQAHMLLNAVVKDDGYCEFCVDEHGRPKMCTSQQLFQDLLIHSVRGKPFRKVSVEVWTYRLVYNSANFPHMRIEVYEVSKSFNVDLDVRYEPRRPRPKLRFGLQVKRKKTKTQQKQPRMKLARQSEPEALSIEPSRNSRKRKVSEPESSSHSASESESSGSEATGAGDGEKDDKEIIPVTYDMKEEEDAAQQLEREHETTKAAALKSVESKGTFFAKEVGVDNIGLAVSARSKCFFCQEKIGKNDPRFSFHHSTQRPSNWVHARCLVPLVRRDDCTQQARTRLAILRAQLMQTSGSQSSGSGQPPESVVLIGAVTAALDELSA